MGNFYSVLFPPAQSFSLVLPTRYVLNLQSTLTEGDRRHLPVAPCQSKRLTVALGIAKWQTVVINAKHNIGHGKFVLLVSSLFFNCSPGCGTHIRCGIRGWASKVHCMLSFLVMLTGGSTWNRSSVSLAEPDSSSATLFVNSVLRTAVIIH